MYESIIVAPKSRPSARQTRTDEPFLKALARLTDERDMSLRELGRLTGINQSHFSRLWLPESRKKPSLHLINVVGKALELPPDYFREQRLDYVVRRLTDARLLDKVYDKLRKESETQPSRRSAAQA